MSETPEAVAPEPPETPPLGDKAAGLLLSIAQDFYRQEKAAEEDVHRTLPFFATALGLIIAALNYAGAQIPEWTGALKVCSVTHKSIAVRVIACDWAALLAEALLVISALLGIGVLFLLARATDRLDYLNLGADQAADRARELRNYHLTRGLEGVSLDEAISADLRDQIIENLVIAVSANHDITVRRYRLRDRAIAFLLWSLFIAFAATIVILITSKFGLMVKEGSP
jgi:hypothetical protein